MPKFHVGSMEEVEDLSKPLAPGTYELEVYSGNPKPMKGKDGTISEGFEFQLRVVNNEEAGSNGTTLFYNTPLTGKGRMFLQQLYVGCGVKWQGEDVDLPEDLLGRLCFAVVENRVYEGSNRHSIKAILPK